MKKKVMVGMSGGVDSSVAAALLIEKGYEVTGVTIRMYPEQSDEKTEKSGAEKAVDDAHRVAVQLDIPHCVLDFQDLFENKVMDYFVKEYLRGRTPNPCVACNRFIKFGAFLDKAISMGMDYIATGHYAKIERDQASGRYLLKKSVTHQKDQTYALYNLTQYQLEKTLMPIGCYDKPSIREMAKKLGIDVADRPDSQEICFIPDNHYERFVVSRTNKALEPGKFVDIHGSILGDHKGLIYYTVGQRKGLGVAFGKPMYVVKLNPEDNTVVLGKAGEEYCGGLFAAQTNWIAIPALESAMRAGVKIRYLAKEADATITPVTKDKVRVDFEIPQRAVTPGQSVVFYKGDTVLGGGIIEAQLD